MNQQSEFRPPVVAIMGHVDHGKTTLLDFIRKSNVVAKEHGGITQHLGAYQVTTKDGKRITFLDTPGHAAFEHIRKRGGEVADICILVVAANDGVMPQTKEAIKHIQKSGASMIVAINKIDVPDADPERVKGQLLEEGVMVESYGGDVVSVEISAKQGQNIDQLLEMIQLVSEMRELKNEYTEPLLAVVLESRMDKGGAVMSLLVKKGVLKRGDSVLVGTNKGSVKLMTNDKGERVDAAYPSDSVEVLGITHTVTPGSLFVAQDGQVVHTEGLDALRVRDVASIQAATSGLLFGGQQTRLFPMIIRADVSNSLEAVLNNLPQRENIQIIEASVGDVTEADVERAEAQKGVVYAFNVRVPSRVLKLADAKGVKVKEYNIIYKFLDELTADLEEFFKEPEKEQVVGKGRVLRVFAGSGGSSIGGTKVEEGTLNVGARVRIVREGDVVAEGTIESAKHLKEDVKRLDKGAEGGIVVETKDKNTFVFAEGDLVEQIRVRA